MNHVLLVSDQAMPNFLPVLNKELKPTTVTLAVSSKMQRRAQWLKNEIEKHQVQILPDIELGENVADVNMVQSVFVKWADDNKELFENSVLNVTGGTKPMAIAAQETFRMGGRPVFYVDIASDYVSWLNDSSQNHLLSSQPTLTQFFGLNGIKIKEGDFKSVVDNEKWRHFYAEIAGDPQKWALSIRALNGIASEAEENESLKFNVPSDVCYYPGWNEMIEMLHGDELICYKKNGGGEKFSSFEARRFCNGIWLEHYVFEILKSFGFDRKRAMMNVKIEDSKGNKNEFDAVFIHKNTCYVIEDKTRNMKRDGVADAAVYKLAQLSSKMGLRVKGILISALSVRSVDKERARAYGVEIIDWLPSLENEFKRILRIL
jgi:hypothetical protein